MATKSDKDLKSSAKKIPAATAKAVKGKKQSEELLDGDDVEKTRSSLRTVTKASARDDDDEAEEATDFDDAEKEVEDEDWDPDFDEFDLPKGGSVKKAVGKKSSKDEDEDDDFKIDDEFKDMFSKSKKGYDGDDDDDY
jgi:hypothetical protein